MIACALCVGSSPEPYLEATLASIASVVDLLVVNDNAGGANPNLATLEASELAKNGRMRIVRTAFVDFATMRNDAFSALSAAASPDWVLWLDADEVHDSGIEALTRHLLPRLGADYRSVDGYTDHFWGSFAWMSDVARRFCVYRYDPALRWRNAIHEKIEGLRGKTLVVPYRYAHYGNVLPPALYAVKDRRYYELGNVAPHAPAAPGQETLESVYGRRKNIVRRYRGSHPSAARSLISRLEREWAGTFAEIDRLFGAQTPLERLTNAGRAAIEEARIKLRYVEHPILSRACHPDLPPAKSS